jgi:hypothetical protein
MPARHPHPIPLGGFLAVPAPTPHSSLLTGLL